MNSLQGNCNYESLAVITGLDQIDDFIAKAFAGHIVQDKSYDILKKILTEVCSRIDILTILIQPSYVDRVYRDSYYNHMAGKHLEVDRFCRKMYLFYDNCYNDLVSYNTDKIISKLIGSIVIKPLREGAVGRTLIDPHFMLPDDRYQLRLSSYPISLYGNKVLINAFPYSMQDRETLTCAEITILNLLDFFSNHFPDYHYILPSNITEVMVRNGFERTLPAHGMSYMMISKALTEFGFFPRLYNKDGLNFNSYKMKCLLHYYVESGIPVAVGIRNKGGSLHSILVVGCEKYSLQRLKSIDSNKLNDLHSERYGRTDNNRRRFYLYDMADACDEYIVMDDDAQPYSVYQYIKPPQHAEYFLNDATVCSIVVPLYKRMYLEAMDARSIALKFLSIHADTINRIYATCASLPKARKQLIGTLDKPLIMRLFLASTNTYHEERLKDQRTTDESIRQIYMRTPMPRFVWIAELYDLQSLKSQKAIGEIVLDATASQVNSTEAIILFRFLNYIGARDRDGNSIHNDWFINSPKRRKDIIIEDMYLYTHNGSQEFIMFSGNLT